MCVRERNSEIYSRCLAEPRPGKQCHLLTLLVLSAAESCGYMCTDCSVGMTCSPSVFWILYFQLTDLNTAVRSMERSQFALFYNLILSDANIFLLDLVDLTCVATADLLSF